jgi:hypothetical protein
MSSQSGVRNEWAAGVPFGSGNSLTGRLSKLGGTLSLADDQVIFKPLWHLGRTRRIAMREIDAVSAFGDKPRRLRIQLTSGKRLVFFALPRRMASIRSDDVSARDKAVASIEAARLAH